jgi:hypothetical protein
MQNRGRVHFAILFIVNPIVILFYQNCSVLPVHSHGLAQKSESSFAERRIASVEKSEVLKCRYISAAPCAE